MDGAEWLEAAWVHARGARRAETYGWSDNVRELRNVVDLRGLVVSVKTRYLYSVSSRLVNVRLDAERLRKAQTLRERGVTLSDVVREAIDERFAGLHRSESQPDVRAIVRRIFEQYPDPPDLPPRDYDVHDRSAARRAILRKLRPVRP